MIHYTILRIRIYDSWTGLSDHLKSSQEFSAKPLELNPAIPICGMDMVDHSPLHILDPAKSKMGLGDEIPPCSGCKISRSKEGERTESADTRYGGVWVVHRQVTHRNRDSRVGMLRSRIGRGARREERVKISLLICSRQGVALLYLDARVISQELGQIGH